MKLKDFTPAQVLMITKSFSTSGKDLMKYSFLDLVFKGVLKVYTEWKLPHPRETRERLYTYVARGEQFENFDGNLHQALFIEPFLEDDYEYQVRSLIKEVYLDLGEQSVFKLDYVYKQLIDEGYYSPSYGFKNVGLFFLNKDGKKLKKLFQEELKIAEEKLPILVDSDKDGTLKLLSKLGSNVLLLESFSDDLVEKLKEIFSGIDTNLKNYEGLNSNSWDFAFEVVFGTFLTTMDFFDSSFESFDSSFDFSSSDFSSDYGGGDLGGGDFGGGDW